MTCITPGEVFPAASGPFLFRKNTFRGRLGHVFFSAQGSFFRQERCSKLCEVFQPTTVVFLAKLTKASCANCELDQNLLPGIMGQMKQTRTSNMSRRALFLRGL